MYYGIALLMLFMAVYLSVKTVQELEYKPKACFCGNQVLWQQKDL